MSGCHMVFESGLKSENQTKNVCVMVNHVHFLNGPPNNLIRPFENRTKKVFKKSNVQISGVWYSDGYCYYNV